MHHASLGRRFGLFRFQLLGLLRGKPNHGYALAKDFERRTGQTVALSHVYRELTRLQALGLARAVGSAARTSSRRREFQVTPLGVEQFEEWLSSPPRLDDAGSEAVSSRAALLSEVAPDLASSIAAQWEAALWKRQKELQSALRALPVEGSEIRTILLNRRVVGVAADLRAIRDVCDHLRLPLAPPEPAEKPAGEKSTPPELGVKKTRRRR